MYIATTYANVCSYCLPLADNPTLSLCVVHMKRSKEKSNSNMDSESEVSPLFILHGMLREFRGPLDEPHYIVVSADFLDYMRKFYKTENFCVMGHSVISDTDVETTEAFLFPEVLWNNGDRPWR